MGYTKKQPETIFKEKVQNDLDTLDYCWHEKIQQVCKRGTPDILACIGGTFIALELKKDEKEEAKPLQKLKLRKIKKAGGLDYVAHPKNWPEIFQFLKYLSEDYSLKRGLKD